MDGNKTFEQWMEEVDAITIAKCGMSIHDLPDLDFMSAFDDGYSAKEFVESDVREFAEEVDDFFDAEW